MYNTFNKKKNTNFCDVLDQILDSACDVLDLPSLNINRATPITTSSTNIYFFNGYDLRPSRTPRIMTGIGLPDLATT